MTLAEVLHVVDLTPEDGRMILIGMVVFFVFWRLVDAIIFKPYFHLYHDREALTFGAEAGSKQILDEAKRISNEVEAKVSEARVSAVAKKLQSITEAKKRAQQIAESAEAHVQALVKESRSQREASLIQTREKVMSEAQKLAEEVAKKLTTGQTSIQ